MIVTLFDTIAEAATIQAKFEAFDAAHPEVFELFERFARQIRATGRKRFSASAICERIRWEYAVNYERDDGWKLSDHYTSRLARKLIAKDESFRDFFELRKLHTA